MVEIKSDLSNLEEVHNYFEKLIRDIFPTIDEISWSTIGLNMALSISFRLEDSSGGVEDCYYLLYISKWVKE